MPVLTNVRWIAASLLAATLLFLPITISPAGSLETAGLCASGDCRLLFGSYCFDLDGHLKIDYRPIMT